jgi:ABC-type uncharacterized transport system permease subunit
LLGPSIVAQGVAQVTQGGVDAPRAPNTPNVWGNSFLWAFASSWIMRWLREHPSVSAFSSETSLKLQRLIAGAVAFLSGLGISFVFDHNTGQLVVSGLALASIGSGLRQFFMQEFVYHSALKRPSPTAKV